MTSTAELIGRCLTALGATRVFGSAASGISGIPGLPHVLVEDPRLAVVLADAAGRIGGGPGVALLPGRVLHLGSQPGAVAERVVVDDIESLPSALAAWDLETVFASVDYELALDLDAPARDELAPVRLEEELRPSTLAADMAGLDIVVVAGPGVVRANAVPSLHEVAERLGAGVVNTWGAKGVYRWDSPYHFGTVGLQARDADLAGLTTADLVIATGLDPDEMPVAQWAAGPVLDVDPRVLDVLTYQWEPSGRALERPDLYTRLAAALQPLYASDAVPISPARAVSDLGTARPTGGLVAADPGTAGLWVARALPTVETASVVVPALRTRGFALAAALAASFAGRPTVAVVDDPVDAETAELLALAEHWGADVVLDVWSADAPGMPPGERLDRLRAGLAQRGPSVVLSAVDLGQTDVLVEVAGPVVAWTEPAPPSGNGQRGGHI